MSHNVGFVCWVFAFVCFVLGAVGVSSRINLVSAGLAFIALAHLIV